MHVSCMLLSSSFKYLYNSIISSILTEFMLELNLSFNVCLNFKSERMVTISLFPFKLKECEQFSN